MTAVPHARRLAACTAASGLATLCAEVLGTRALRPLLGSAGLAQAGAVAGVLGGLGLGAWWVGRAPRAIDARSVLVRVHLGLGALCLVAMDLAHGLAGPVARTLVPLGETHPGLAELLRGLLGLAVTLPPGIAAGSVYPAAVALLGRGAGAGTAWVGALSSFGAALGVLGVTFGLGPRVGVRGSLWVVAGLYLCVSLWARQLPKGIGLSQEVRGPPRSRALLGAAMLAGVASTTWQGVATRLGELSWGPSALCLAVAVAAHVTALGAGEAMVVSRVERVPDPRRALGRALGIAGLLAALAIVPGQSMPWVAQRVLAHGAPPGWRLWTVAFLTVTALALPVVGLLGATMALGARALATGPGDRAGANGALLCAMGAGNVLGAFLTPVALFPWVRLEGAMAVAAGVLLAAGALARGSTWRRSWGFGALALGLAGVGVYRAREHPEAVLTGPFLYAGGEALDLGRVLWRRDGRDATVAVRQDDSGALLLQLNGKVDATSEGDRTTQTVVGIVPALLAREPRDVLVVGLGSGMTADAARSVPGVRTVRVVELLPEVILAARRDFAVANRGVLDAPGVTVETVDAVHYLRGTSRRFDVIVNEPSNPWVAGMSELFTVQALAAARERLRPGGVLGQWFHGYSTDLETVTQIVATFREVFPRAGLVEVAPGQDYLLVGVREPYQLDVDAMLARCEHASVRGRLAEAGVPDAASLVSRFLAGSGGVAAVAGDASALDARDLVLEFRAPGALYHDATAELFGRFARIADQPFAGLSPRGSRYLPALDASEPLREARTHARAMVLRDREGDLPGAITEGELAVGLLPGDLDVRTVLARLYLRRAAGERRARDPGAAELSLVAALELRPRAAERLRALVTHGDLLLRRREARRALARYDEAAALLRATGQRAAWLQRRRAEALILLGAPAQAAEALNEGE
ncbi:MAG: hypothetical protein HY909_09360 [Deltaproteobacteria bacterium]|nr:hypothetical protein [Deltaproteobacteria bacterium]